ncbi:MAG: cation:proton antiporter [Candidatus Heimdallarchaeota archaeon]
MSEIGVMLSEIGLILIVGLLGTRVLKKLHIPKVLGFIIIGYLIGLVNRSIFPFMQTDMVNVVTPHIITITLGLIGFNIGAELSWQTLKKMDRKMFFILLADTLGTLVIVTTAVYFLTNMSFYSALILGSLAAATAPAATTEVLWEYKAAGVLTTAILVILALDDIASVIFVQVSKGITMSSINGNGFDFLEMATVFFSEIGIALVVGVSFGLFIVWLANKISDKESLLELVLVMLVLLVGLSMYLHFSVILSCMAFGTILSSFIKKDMEDAFHKIYKVGTPVIALFFICVGLKIQIPNILTIGIIGIVYLVSRSLGKVGGVSLTAKLVKSPKVIQRYLGPSLISQAGVALGLAASIETEFLGTIFEHEASMILTIITGTVVVLEIVGPLLVKFSIFKANETNRKLTRELPTEKPGLTLNLPITQIQEEKSKDTETGKRFSVGYLNSIYDRKNDSASGQKADSANKMELKSELSSDASLTKGD